MRSRDDSTDTSTPAAVPFAIGRRDLDQRTSVIAVEGELDLTTAPQLKWVLVDANEEGYDRLIVDLSPTTFMDSTALGVLIGVNRNLDEGGGLTIVCAKESLLRIFELSGLDGVFTIRPTLDDALAYVARRTAEAG